MCSLSQLPGGSACLPEMSYLGMTSPARLFSVDVQGDSILTGKIFLFLITDARSFLVVLRKRADHDSSQQF